MLLTGHHAARIKGSGTTQMEAKLGTILVGIHSTWRGQMRERSTYSDQEMFWSLMENSVAELLMLWMSIIHSALTLVSIVRHAVYM